MTASPVGQLTPHSSARGPPSRPSPPSRWGCSSSRAGRSICPRCRSRKLGEAPELRAHLDRCTAAVRRIVDMIGHMRRITRLETTAIRTGGAPTLDLRRSAAPAEPAAAEPEARAADERR